MVTDLGYDHPKRHGLRHTELTWMADAGVPLHSLRKIAGHGTLTTTRALHDVGIEASAFVGVHRRIDPQRSRRAFASHAVTLSSPTDTYRARRVADRHVRRIWRDLVRARRRVRRGAGRT